jgi:hypothetical protein
MTSDLASSHDAPAWGFIEAWLLLSIDDHGRRGCNLSQMIGTADGRNHDIPTEQATATALGRLEASGLIDSSARTFKVSKEATRSSSDVPESSSGRHPASCPCWPRSHVETAYTTSSLASSTLPTRRTQGSRHFEVARSCRDPSALPMSGRNGARTCPIQQHLQRPSALASPDASTGPDCPRRPPRSPPSAAGSANRRPGS